MQVPSQVLAAYQSVNDKANATASQPFQNYNGEFVAPINAQQNVGVSNTNAAAEEAQPGYATAQAGLGQAQANTTPVNNAALGLAGASAGAVDPTNLDAASIGKYLSPYLGTVLGTTNALANQNNSIAQTGALGTAINSGAFGGDRAGIAAANLNQQNSLAEQATDANILNTGYNTALSTAQQQQGVGLGAAQANRTALANAGQEIAGIGQTAYGEGANTAAEEGSLASGAQTAGLQGAQAQIGAGTLEQQTAQASDTAQYNQFLQEQSYPFQVDQFLANIAEGTGALSGSTTQTSQPGGFFSDKRLKHDIKKIGKTYDGQEIYSYKMHGDNRTHIGLIAQKVEKKHPEAVGLAGGYKIVDYGRATEDAANRGHFYSGGVVPMRRVAYADGGAPYDYLDMQRQMYAPIENKQRNIPSQGAQSHQLAVASGSPSAPPSGASNLNSTMGLVNNGQRLYKQFNSPSSPSGVSPGLGDTSGLESSAMDASAPAADASTASGLAPAAESAAPAAASAAASGAAGAAVDAGATEAAALAAEYAAADAAVALVAAKRGGRIVKRQGLDAGGMPYEGAPGAGTPYAQDDGTLAIPDQANTNKLQTAGPIKKQPTGLQTMLTMSDPNSAAGIAGSLFSNQGLGSARGGRIHKDDGGGIDDDMPELTVEGQRPDPVAYDGGVAPASTKVDEEAAPIVKGLKASEPDSGSSDHWWKHSENVVPLLTGLAAMGTAPTKHLGVALAAGLGAGAQSWLPSQQQEADVQKTQLQNQMTGAQLGALRGAMAPQSSGSSATPYGPPPTDSSALPAYYAQKYNTNMTPAELQRLNSAQVAGGAMKNPGLAASVQTDYQQRLARQTQDANLRHDNAYTVASAPSDNFRELAKVDPVPAAAIAKSLGFDPAGGQIPPQADAAAKKYATDNVGYLHPWTSTPKYEDSSGANRDTRTGKPALGPAAQQMSIDARSGRQISLAQPVTYGAGLPKPLGQAAGIPDAPPGAAPAPAAAAPSAPPVVAPPQRPAPHRAVAPAVAVDPVMAKALADPAYKLAPIPQATDQVSLQAAKDQQKATSDKRAALHEDAEQAAQSTGSALQFALAAKQIMDSKGAPTVGLTGNIAKTISSVFGGVDATNYQEVAKYLGNLAVQSGKGNFPHATEKENMVQFNDLSPSVKQTGDALRDLLNTNVKNLQYTLDTANRATSYLDPKNNGDPQKFFRWNQAHFPRADAVNTPEAQETGKSKSGRDIVRVNGRWQYKD